MMSLSTRLKIAMEARGIKQAPLAEKVNFSQQTLSRLISGKNTYSEYLPNIARVLDVDPGWLLFGTGLCPDFDRRLPAHQIPILTWSNVMQWPKIEITKETPSTSRVAGADDECYGLIIENDFMVSSQKGAKTFRRGEKIIVNPHLVPKNGHYVIAHEKGADSAALKLYVVDGKRTYLKNLNPDYPSTVEVNDEVSILGVVIAHLDILV